MKLDVFMKAMLGVTVATVVLTLPQPRASSGAKSAATDVPDCVDVRSATRASGYGYDHIVYVHNRCTIAIDCTIGTNRNPKPEFGLVVPPGMEKGVVTGTHSRRRHFKPWVRCKLRAKASLDRAKSVLASGRLVMAGS